MHQNLNSSEKIERLFHKKKNQFQKYKWKQRPKARTCDIPPGFLSLDIMLIADTIRVAFESVSWPIPKIALWQVSFQGAMS
jgi:hypothetical protein